MSRPKDPRRRASAPSSTKSYQQGSSRRPSPSSAMHPTSSEQAAFNRTAQPQRKPTKRRYRLTLRGKVFLGLLVLFLVLRLINGGDASSDGMPTTKDIFSQVKQGFIKEEDKSGFDESIGSDSAILINAVNGDVLYEKDADRQRPPASLTKMMTVYVAIKHNEDLDRKVQMPKAAFDGLAASAAATSGLVSGETVTVRDLLYAAMLPSGADAAQALALITSGNTQGFVDLMNEEAKKMHLDSTKFANPVGIDADGQYSTCRDMARLLKIALGDTVFSSVITAKQYTTSANETHPEGLSLEHTMVPYLTKFERYFDTSGYKIAGGKTGFTNQAGNCLATFATYSGEKPYIAVTMHATGNSDQYYQSMKDAVQLYAKVYEK